MGTAALIITCVIIWHFAGLNAVATLAGSLADSAFIPRSILKSKYHKAGLASAALGTGVILVFGAFGYIGYGVIIGGALMLLDTILSYFAVSDYIHRADRARTQSTNLTSDGTNIP
jgi:predicted PurR-regulated permease PerM